MKAVSISSSSGRTPHRSSAASASRSARGTIDPRFLAIPLDAPPGSGYLLGGGAHDRRIVGGGEGAGRVGADGHAAGGDHFCVLGRRFAEGGGAVRDGADRAGGPARAGYGQRGERVPDGRLQRDGGRREGSRQGPIRA